MITADQIVAHLIGDYILQSDWMANEKRRQNFAAAAHALFYSLPFIFFRPSLYAWSFIVVTHFVIDRWRLARYVCWIKNFIGPRWTWLPWSECAGTGYSEERPLWLAAWLMIIADNTMHILLNGLALRRF